MWSCTLLAYLKCFLSDSASKHATQAYFDCLRAEVDRFGLQVSVISPGYIRTNLSINAVTGDGSKYGGESMLFLSTIWVIKDVLENEYHKYTNCNIIHVFFCVCVFFWIWSNGQNHSEGVGSGGRGTCCSESCLSQTERCCIGWAAAYCSRLSAHTVARSLLQTDGFTRHKRTQSEGGIREHSIFASFFWRFHSLIFMPKGKCSWNVFNKYFKMDSVARIIPDLRKTHQSLDKQNTHSSHKNQITSI